MSSSTDRAPAKGRILAAIATAGTIAVGSVLIIAAIGKSLEPTVTAASLRYLLPDALDGAADRLVVALSLFEALLGAALISGWRQRLVARVGAATVVLFSLVLARYVADPWAPDCGCGSLLKMADDARTANALGLARNAAMLAALAPAALRRRRPSALAEPATA